VGGDDSVTKDTVRASVNCPGKANAYPFNFAYLHDHPRVRYAADISSGCTKAKRTRRSVPSAHVLSWYAPYYGCPRLQCELRDTQNLEFVLAYVFCPALAGLIFEHTRVEDLRCDILKIVTSVIVTDADPARERKAERGHH